MWALGNACWAGHGQATRNMLDPGRASTSMSPASQLYIAGTVLSVLAWLREKRDSRRLVREITQLQDSLAGQVKERSAERTGRVKAEARGVRTLVADVLSCSR